jgi:ketosteroid isomerase-like protein
MSQENVEIVRRMVEAFNSADMSRAISSFHADAEFTSALTEARTYVGSEGLAEYVDDISLAWESWRSADDQFVDVDDERVVWLYRIIGTGRGSGVPVDQRLSVVWTMRYGLIWRGQSYLDHRQALEAVGLAD